MGPQPSPASSAGAFPYGAPAEATARFCPWCYRDGSGPCVVQAHWPEIRARRPVFLSGVECSATRQLEAAGADVGLMLQPASGLDGRAQGYRFWAADNGCFSAGESFDAGAWFAWLAALPDVADRRRCLFAVAPDVLGDAEATWRRSRPWLAAIRSLGIPVAMVAQNGVEAHAPTWDAAADWDVLFLGGAPQRPACRWIRSDPADRSHLCPRCSCSLREWKLSPDARLCVDEAQLLGKWVHVGRVNSWRRLRHVAAWDVDPVDGTYLAFGPDRNGARLAGWLRRLETEGALW